MSFDITVGYEDFNYTYNMGQFFEDFEVHPYDWNGKTPSEVAEQIGGVFSVVADHSLEYLKCYYDAPNGWGSVDTALRFLFNVYMACLEADDSTTVEVT